MTRMLRIVVLLLAAVATAGAQPPTKVMLVHGINATSGTWDPLFSLLQGDSRFAPYRTSLDSRDYLTNQANGLVSYLNANVGSGAFLTGHSQGGLISRKASRTYAAGAILTIGTPHYGAPIAGSVDDASLWFGVLGGALLTATYSLDDVLNDPFSVHYRDVAAALPEASWLYGFALEAVALMLQVIPQTNNLALDDLSGATSFLGTLNSQAGSESGGTRRQAIVVQVDGGYLGGVLRLGVSAELADALGSDINAAGNILIASSIGIESECGPAHLDWLDHTLGAIALFDAGLQLVDYPAWWSFDIVGGYPSDMVVPTWSQEMPSSTVPALNFAGPSHVQETSMLAPLIRDWLVALRDIH